MKYFFSLLFLFLVAIPLHAKELTIDEAIAEAINNNPSLQQSLQEVVVSKANLRQAGIAENPNVTASFEFAERTGSEVLPHITATQNVLDFYLASLRKKAAHSQLEESTFQSADATLNLVLQVKKAFYSLQAIEQFRAKLEEIVQSAKTGAELSNRQADAGNINAIERNVQQLIAEQAEIELIRSDADLKIARSNLAELLGHPDLAEKLTIVKTAPAIPSQERSLKGLEETALAHRLDLAAIRQKNVSLDSQYKLAKWHGFPSFQLGIESEKDIEGGTRTGPQIGFDLPLFDHGQGEKEKVKAQMNQNQYFVSAMENRVRGEVKEALFRLNEARSIALRYQERVIPILDNTLKETEKQYNFMLKGVFDLLQIKREQINAQRQYLGAVKDYWIAEANLEKAIGGKQEK